MTRVSDIGRVELGAQNYGINAFKNKERAVALSVNQAPGSNALEVAAAVLQTMRELKQDFPPGIAYDIIYNPSEYIRASVVEVERTLVDAAILVVIVVILFLQSWRTAVIPLLAIPVSIIGTCTVLGIFGFSLNNLSMFGLVLSIGIVIDDAIVVVENVERHIRAGLSPREAAHVTMDEVGGALIGIALVLIAVFVPTAFMGGIAGQFYKQFALTIATATLISLVVSLSLSPTLAALILKPHDRRQSGETRAFCAESPPRSRVASIASATGMVISRGARCESAPWCSLSMSGCWGSRHGELSTRRADSSQRRTRVTSLSRCSCRSVQRWPELTL